MLDEEHEFADVEEGQAGNLKTGEIGSAYILWREATSGAYCSYGYGYGGLVWAVVRLSNISEKSEQWGTV